MKFLKTHIENCPYSKCTKEYVCQECDGRWGIDDTRALFWFFIGYYGILLIPFGLLKLFQMSFWIYNRFIEFI